jgi:hypothetical protein
MEDWQLDDWTEWMYKQPSREIIAGWQDGPLVLTSVSRRWCQIATMYPLLWSTILIDQSQVDCLERIHLFLDRSGKEPLNIVLLYYGTPSLPVTDFLMEHADRFKTFAVLEVIGARFPSQMELPKALAPFVNLIIHSSSRHPISIVPIPRCVRHLQLRWTQFKSRSLIPFTYLHNLKYLSISINHEPKAARWDKKVRFELLQYLCLDVSYPDEDQSIQSTSQSIWIDWLECPALVDLSLSCGIPEVTCDETYAHLEGWLLNFRSLRNLRVYISIWVDQDLGPFTLQNMQRSTFDGTLELVELYLSLDVEELDWGVDCTDRFFSVFTPRTHLVWPYAQFPSPAIFPHLKTVHITDMIPGDGSPLVPPGFWGMTQMEFLFLEELSLESRMVGVPTPSPALLNCLRAPRLKSLHIAGFIPLDLRHISNSTISSVSLTITHKYEGPKDVYLPCDHLHLELPVWDLFQLNVHPSVNQCVTITTTWQEVSCPPNWTMEHVSEMLGTVTDLTVGDIHFPPRKSFSETLSMIGNLLSTHPTWLWPVWYLSGAIPSFLRSFVFLKCLELFCWKIGEATWIDQLAQHLPDPNFLPALEALSIAEYPSWPDLFQNIQQRQIGFLTGRFQTALREVTIKPLVHGALLGHLRESLAGRYIGLLNMPPRREGSKDWPVTPFKFSEVDTDGFLCCYICQRAGLEIACMVVHSYDASRMERCARAQGQFGQRLNKVFAP